METAKAANQFQETLENFTRVDLETSIQFASTALESDDPDKVERNKRKAMSGYKTALHLLPRAVFLTDDRRVSVQEQIKQLRGMLTQLGGV